ncbi:hypothetical protein GTW68_21330 [Streptomyces sp. SID4945]|nr:hypothetical protein [Streptomyces sp. SID4945]
MGIEGGPRDGGHAQVDVDEDGRPPGILALDGTTYRLALHGIEPHDERWHYCAGGA